MLIYHDASQLCLNEFERKTRVQKRKQMDSLKHTHTRLGMQFAKRFASVCVTTFRERNQLVLIEGARYCDANNTVMMRSSIISPAPTTMYALPNEILQGIFQNLIFRDRKNASRVCHRWNEIVMDCNTIVFHVRLYDTKNTYTISEIMNCKRPYKFLRVSYNILPSRILNKFSNSVETLRISSVNAYMTSEEPNFLGQLYRLKKLKHLIIDCTFVPDSLQIAKHTCNNLSELIACEVSFANFVNFNEFISAAFPELTKLLLTECDFDVPLSFSNLSALEELAIECGTPFDCTLLKDLGSLPYLRAFKLCCSQLDGMGQIGQSFQLHHITKLDLTVCVGDCHLVRLVEIFPSMISLSVAAREEYLSADVEGKAVGKVSRSCQLKLEKLSSVVTDGDRDGGYV